ncbi:MAG: toprim domain-containing protein [SAR324 cluster bacterium]|nr:toprim domain-containing protein [SAR324 cluster bacterium]
MSQPKDPSNETVLELMLQHSRYSHFKRIGTDDYRDPANDHFKLSSKGYADFKSGEFGKSLTSFAKKEGLEELIGEARKIDGLNDNSFPKNSNTKADPEKNKEAAIKLWKQAESEISKKQVIAYLTEQRKLLPESFDDLLSGYIRAVSDQDGNAVLLVPMIDAKQAQFAAAGSSFNVEKVQRIILKKDGKEKKQLGGGDSIGRLTYFPPLSANGESLQCLVSEGLENALTIRSEYPDHHFLLTHGKGNFKHVPEFLPKGAEVSIISDHDAHGDPKKNGETAAAELNQTLRSKGFLTSALMPAEPKQDANAALQAGTLDKWFRSLIAVPSLAAETPTLNVISPVCFLIPFATADTNVCVYCSPVCDAPTSNVIVVSVTLTISIA